jgi:hypothetical protein
MKRKDLERYLEIAKPKIENAIAQAVKSGDGVVALHLQFTLCYFVGDDDTDSAPIAIPELVRQVFGALEDNTEPFDEDFPLLPTAYIDPDGTMDIGSPSSFVAFVVDPDSDTILVEMLPTNGEDRHVGMNVWTKQPHNGNTETHEQERH